MPAYIRPANAAAASTTRAPPATYVPAHVPTATYVPVAHEVSSETNFCDFVACLPRRLHRDVMRPILKHAENIAADRSNDVLDPPTFYCDSGKCQFSRGDIMGQIHCCLKRVYQLAAELDVARSWKHGEHHE